MIYFLIPVYNEEANIPNLYRELSGLALTDNVHYVFSDDGSSDNTKVALEKYFAPTNHVVLGDGINRGPGAAFNAGFRWIVANATADDDVIVTMEADCTSDTAILPTMLALNKLGYDLVLASVYAQGGGFDQTSFLRKLISAIANFMYRFLFDIKVLTLSSFYRVYRLTLVKKIQTTYQGQIISEPGFVSMLEILTKAIWCHAKVIEVPMQLHSSKRIGKSKMNILKTTIAYFRYLIKWKMRSPKQ